MSDLNEFPNVNVLEGNRLVTFPDNDGVAGNPGTVRPRKIHNHLFDANPYGHLTAEQLDKAKKALQAWRNAQNSTGPRTEEGKRIASQNARKHGYAGAAIVLADEERWAFEMHLDSYFASFHPVTQVECDYVRRAAEAQWRLDRLTSIETGLLDLEYDHVRTFTDVVCENLQFHHYLAIAFLEKVSSDNALDLCRRYQSAAARDCDRAIKMFYTLKTERMKDDPEQQQQQQQPQETQSVPNEPTPKPPKPAIPPPIAITNRPKPVAKAPSQSRRRKDRRKS